MTKTSIIQNIPLTASSTSAGSVCYGTHPITLSDSTNNLDLPDLIPQSTDHVPAGEVWEKWERSKRSELAEAWHFYCVDAKFETILREPQKVIDTGAEFAVEVNVRSFQDDPLPIALAGLWRKRCVSRIWQEAGINVFVDLFVDGWSRELVLEGVPKDHCLYATKFARSGRDDQLLGLKALAADHALAVSHCSNPEKLRFAVYGGGKQVKLVCEMNGWLWLPTYNNR